MNIRSLIENWDESQNYKKGTKIFRQKKIKLEMEKFNAIEKYQISVYFRSCLLLFSVFLIVREIYLGIG
jgi:hypothetical protein